MDAILFDLDGTLTDPREGITRCIAQALDGTRALGVTWGYGSRDELREAGAQAFCESPGEIPDCVARLLEPRRGPGSRR